MLRSEYQDRSEYLQKMEVFFYSLGDYEYSAIYKQKRCALEANYYANKSRPAFRATIIIEDL